MSKIMVEISGEMVDNIILQEIQDTKEMLTEQLERVKLNGKGDVFDLDVKTEVGRDNDSMTRALPEVTSILC